MSEIPDLGWIFTENPSKMMAGLLEVLGDPGISRISCLQYVTAVASTDRPQLVTPERVEPKLLLVRTYR